MNLPVDAISAPAGQWRPPDIHVLVVEGDEPSRSALVTFIRAFGVSVTAAADGAQAYRLVLERRPDLLLCDLQMPVRDGFELMRRLRREPSFRQILAVAVTGSGNALDVTLVRAAGFDGHVVKPITGETLARLLDRAVDLRNALDRGEEA